MIVSIIFYLIGFIVSYILCRDINRTMYLQYDWNRVLETFLGAVFSWLFVLIIIYAMIENWLHKNKRRNIVKISKPLKVPRWL